MTKLQCFLCTSQLLVISGHLINNCLLLIHDLVWMEYRLVARFMYNFKSSRAISMNNACNQFFENLTVTADYNKRYDRRFNYYYFTILSLIANNI